MNRSILFIIGDLDIGGTERHLAEILPALVGYNLSPIVYTLTHKGKLAPILEEQGIRVIAPPLSSLTRVYREMCGGLQVCRSALWVSW